MHTTVVLEVFLKTERKKGSENDGQRHEQLPVKRMKFSSCRGGVTGAEGSMRGRSTQLSIGE